MTHKVFVYGSLKRGLGNHVLLAGSTFLGLDKVESGFNMVSLGAFPGVVPANPGYPVLGEVWEITDEVLSDLDMLEGHPRFYRRVRVPTRFGEAWIYVLPPEYDEEQARVIRGVWRMSDEEEKYLEAEGF